LESSVSESEAEDSDEETAEGECKSSDSQRRKTPKAKTNGTTWVRVSLCPKQNRYMSSKWRNYHCRLFLTKRLRMWKANYGLSTREELIPFLRSVDREVRQFSTNNNLRKYQSKFLHLCQNCVKNNESLETDFRALIATLPNLERTSDEIVGGIFKELTSTLANTRINEFLNPKGKIDLRMQGKVVDADEMLRPKLKLYALVSKRKV